MQAILGIDPGISGAAMLLRGDCVTLVGDMPVADVRGRKTIDPAAVVAMIRAAGTIHMAVLEHVQGVQQAGATSAFSFGRGFGLLEGVLAGVAVKHRDADDLHSLDPTVGVRKSYRMWCVFRLIRPRVAPASAVSRPRGVGFARRYPAAAALSWSA